MREEILRRLGDLSEKHRIAFAASCCERVIPGYKAFILIHHLPDPDFLQRTMDEMWMLLKDTISDRNHVGNLIQSVEESVPSMDVYHSMYVQLAQGAVNAVLFTLKCFTDRNMDEVTNVVDIVIHVVDTYVRSVNVPWSYFPPRPVVAAFEEWADQAPLLMAEIEKQLQDLESLRSQVTLEPAFLDDLRRAANAVGSTRYNEGWL